MRRIAMTLATMAGVIGASADETVGSKEWFAVPHDQSALVFLVEGQSDKASIGITDAKNVQLDNFAWDFGAPLIRQYRLKPGPYRIYFKDIGDKPLNVVLEPGSLGYVRISPQITNGANLTAAFTANAEPKNVRETVQALFLKGEDKVITPAHLAPADNTLYVNTEPPFEIPKPQTEPKPQ
jgi:hypothetical protein